MTRCTRAQCAFGPRWTASPLTTAPSIQPVVDSPAACGSSQDWVAECGSEENGVTDVVVSRLLRTGDWQDRDLLPSDSPHHVIFAWGRNGQDAVGYHGPSRGSVTVDLFAAALPPPPSDAEFVPPADGTTVLDLNFSAYTVSSQASSQYVCHGFDLGPEARHIVAVRPLVWGPSAPLVHHFVLHDCGDSLFNNVAYRLSLPPQACLANPATAASHGQSPLGQLGCVSFVYTWAPGVSSLVLPAAAGIRAGTGGARYLVLEVHMNNPTLMANVPLNAGVRLYLTATGSFRANDAGALLIGDPVVSFSERALSSFILTHCRVLLSACSSLVAPAAVSFLIPCLRRAARLGPIPPRTALVHRAGTCSSACTARFGGEVTVFSSFLHMHMLGRQAWTSLRRTDGSRIITNARQFWNFGEVEPSLLFLCACL